MYISQRFPPHLQYVVLQIRWKFLRCIHREFFYKSPGERILKIGPHLPKSCQTVGDVKHQGA